MINKRIKEMLKEQHMTQAELSRKTGIPTSTINEWVVRKKIPAADKIMPLCNAFGITPEELLTEKKLSVPIINDVEIKPGDLQILTTYHNFSASQQKRLLSYMKRIQRETANERKK